MTDSTIPSAEQLENTEPDKNSVIARESDDGIRIRANIISGITVDRTEARTYTRTFGHYFVDSESKESEVFDEFIATYTASNSVISRFQRNRGEAYEVTVEIDDSIKSTDHQFRGSREAVIEIPSHSKYVETLEQFISEIEEEVSDD